MPYTPEIALAQFLETMMVVTTGDGDQAMECGLCGAELFLIEANDTLRVLLNSCLAHNCI